jgi:hypothetical protein
MRAARAKILSGVAFNNLKAAVTEKSHIPKVAVVTDEGDFDTFITHDLTDNTTWPGADNSTYVLSPAAGKTLYIKKAEVQFTDDAKMSTASTPTELYFDTYMYYPPADAVVLVRRITYKSIRDVYNYGNAHYESTACDGLTGKIITVQFNYPKRIPIISSQQMRVEISLKDHQPLEGQFTTISFVTDTEDEEL